MEMSVGYSIEKNRPWAFVDSMVDLLRIDNAMVGKNT